MAVTAASDLFVPEVIGDMATDILFSKVPLLRDGYVRDASPAVFADGGNEVTFPYFDTDITGLVQDNPGATRSGVTADKVEMKNYKEPVKSKIISFDADKNALADALQSANIQGHIAELVARKSAVAIQSDLVLAAQGTNLLRSIVDDSTKTLTVDAILDAKMEMGEYSDEAMPILYVTSKQAKDLAKTSDFKTLASASTPVIANASNMPQGAIGVVHNCWVKLMDSVRNQANIPAITGITRVTTVATVTTASAHGLVPGDIVKISGATQTQYNGTHTVATTPTATTFTYAVADAGDSPATGSPVFTPNYTGILVYPNALGLYIKKGMTATMKDVHAGTTVATWDFDFRYATTLFRDQPRGVVKLVTQ